MVVVMRSQAHGAARIALILGVLFIGAPLSPVFAQSTDTPLTASTTPSAATSTPATASSTPEVVFTPQNASSRESVAESAIATSTSQETFEMRLAAFKARNIITLSASWNGIPILSGNSIALPLNQEGTLTWSFTDDSTAPPSPYVHHANDDGYISLYQGSIGSSTDMGGFSDLMSEPDNDPHPEDPDGLYLHSKYKSGQTPFPVTFSHTGHYTLLLLLRSIDGLCMDGTTPFANPCTQYADIDGRNSVQFITTGKSLDTAVALTQYLPMAYGAIEFDIVDSATTTATSTVLSNVLFLPGIEGSKLYKTKGSCSEDCSEKLWDPSLLGGNNDVRDLFLTVEGKSVRSDIHTTPDGVLQDPYGMDVYNTFTESLTGFCAEHTLTCVETPYDWRLSLREIIENGKEEDGIISYTQATSSPYIEQTLRALASASKTGKVTIVAHSNGGLVAKALLQKLGDAQTQALIDRVIFVAVPQAGAPETVAQLLVGYDAGLPKKFPIIVSPATVRSFAQNAPMAYHLLPSETYFSTLLDDGHPVVSFTGSHLYEKEIAAYGSTISTQSELNDFLLAREGGRTQPKEKDLLSPAVANETLVAYGNEMHRLLDSWVPPSGVMLYQIAGWGVDTLSGTHFYEFPGLPSPSPSFVSYYRPEQVEDGDGVVPVSSALMIPSDTNVKNYWVNLEKINSENAEGHKEHGSILSVQGLNALIQNVITGTQEKNQTNIYPYQPVSIKEAKRLRFYIHSPVSLSVTDAHGNLTGLASDGSLSEKIPDSRYGEFGEVKYISVPASSTYTLTLLGEDEGSFTLDVQELIGDIVGTTTSFAHIPVHKGSRATLTLNTNAETLLPLEVDEDGDGNIDISLTVTPGTIGVYTPEEKDIAKTEPRTSYKLAVMSEATATTTTPTIATTNPKSFHISVPARAMYTSGEVLGTTSPETEEPVSHTNWFSTLYHTLYTWITSLVSFFRNIF